MMEEIISVRICQVNDVMAKYGGIKWYTCSEGES